MTFEYPTQPLFIVIEGPDGSGKTTQLFKLASALRHTSAGREVIVAKEPGGTSQGMKIRQLFLDGQGELVPMAEVLLLLAAKAQLIREVIEPALSAGKIVLMDRYTDSLLAYQGSGRKMGASFLKEIVKTAELNLEPTLTFFISTPLPVCFERLNNRAAHENNSIDGLEQEYHERVHAGYCELISLAKLNGRPHFVIDGTMSPDEIHVEILKHLGLVDTPVFEMRD